MKKITLTQNKFALVDDEDFDFVNQYSWYTGKHHAGIWYAMRSIWIPELYKNKRIWLHREILKLTDNSIKVDHVDGDGLNNQKANLRIASTSNNNSNRKPWKKRKFNISYKGVYRRKKHYEAAFSMNGKTHYLGCFDNQIDAALAYDKAARENFGEFARLNFPDQEVLTKVA